MREEEVNQKHTARRGGSNSGNAAKHAKVVDDVNSLIASHHYAVKEHGD